MTHIALHLPRPVAAVSFALMLAMSGCGLKGALTMPSQSEEIVIRPAAGTAEASSSAETGEGAASPAPATPPATRKVAPADERLPPPPLPGANPGTVRGG